MYGNEDRLDEVPPFDEGAALDVVRAFLDEAGEVSAEVLFLLSMVQEDQTRFERAAMRLRAEHFKARGLHVPPMPKPKRPLE